MAIGSASAVLAGAVLGGVAAAGWARSGHGRFVRMPVVGSPASALPRTVRVTSVGDVIMGTTPKLPPHGGRTFFDDVRPALRGDVVTGNLESPLTDRTRSVKCDPSATAESTTARPGPGPSRASETGGCYAFRVPPSYARWLAGAGFTVLNLANNHARDYGTGGLDDTRAALTAHTVGHTGFAGQITTLRIGGVRVAVLGFSPYGWTNSVLDVPAARALVRRAGADADLIVVNMHIGAEGASRTHVVPGPETFLGESRGDPIRFAHAVVDAGADLVVGHGPHVLRGMEFYRGRLIAYSMGNFAGYRTLSSAGPLGIGAVLSVRLRPDGSWAGGTLTGTHLVEGGLPAGDPAREALPLVRRVSVADFSRRAMRVGTTGALAPPE